MAGSKRFRELRYRIRQLRNHFLPRTFDPTGTYSERQFDRARAFRLLAHAEIEWYLEQIVFETANKAFDDWKQRGMITLPLLAMVAYVDVHLGGITQPNKNSTQLDLESRIEKSKNRFNTYTKSNNYGIKEEHILRLLLPIGIKESDLDQIWLSTASSFGRTRGETAHVSNKVNNPPDPKNEYDIVNQILQGLLDIDVTLLKLRTQ